MAIFYKPDDGFAADFIPFYWEGQYHLFYLKDYRDEATHGYGTPWWHVVTKDFVHFEDWGEALPRGPIESQDACVFTGCVLEHEGTFHIFYTGHNNHLKEKGKPIQAVMHATSTDLRVWEKDPGIMFFAPTEKGFEQDDWRDPFVFWNGEAKEFWMLLAARKTAGPKRNRGCIALAASADLQHWDVRDPFWAPDEYYTHECPDLFRMGDWWYLVYSTFSERFVTHYRMSRSLQGPWYAPANDTFDGRAYYAAKTAGDGERRYVFGWLPTRSNEKDDGSWNWGGHLVVHEIVQRSDGSLIVRAPERVMNPFKSEIVLTPRPVLGLWKVDADALSTHATGRFSALALGEMPGECLIETAATFSAGTCNCGLFLRADGSFDNYYEVRLEPANQRMVIDRWPRAGDQAFMLERPVAMKPEHPVTLRILIDGTCLVVYANDEIALSCRMYDHQQGSVGLFVTEGDAAFRGMSVKSR